MTTEPVLVLGGRERTVGQVRASIDIANAYDVHALAEGRRPPAEVRRIHLDRVLFDTGANELCLPADIVAQLGLPLRQRVVVQTAGGITEMALHDGAEFTVAGRTRVFSCIALPEGSPPLVGVIPMESLGIELDLQHEALRLLPDEGPDTYITAL
ncbi:MAG: aspartyl protease family protein [Dehalococcoidia bacterium]|nr:aspartyl protease family protein [Dehalococcoidia bacterium]